GPAIVSPIASDPVRGERCSESSPALCSAELCRDYSAAIRDMFCVSRRQRDPAQLLRCQIAGSTQQNLCRRSPVHRECYRWSRHAAPSRQPLVPAARRGQPALLRGPAPDYLSQDSARTRCRRQAASCLCRLTRCRPDDPLSTPAASEFRLRRPPQNPPAAAWECERLPARGECMEFAATGLTASPHGLPYSPRTLLRRTPVSLH